MKRILFVILIAIVILMPACSAGTGMSEDEQLAAAQQTLDALNQGGGQATPVPPTQVPPADDPPTPVPPTAAPAGPEFAGAVGDWISTDNNDGSQQSVRIADAGGGSFSFDYVDFGASVCGLDANGSPFRAFRTAGTGQAAGDTLLVPAVPGTCDETGQTVTVDWTWTYQPGNDSLVDMNGIVWNRGTPDQAGSGESVSSIRFIDLDNAGPLWDNNCNTLQQPMADFGTGWLEDDQLFGDGLNCDLGFDLQITQSGLYEVYLNATYAPDFGMMSLTFNRGAQNDFIFNIALYDPTIRPTGELPLGQWRFNADEQNYLAFVMYDKQPESTGYKFGLDYLKLVLIELDF